MTDMQAQAPTPSLPLEGSLLAQLQAAKATNPEGAREDVAAVVREWLETRHNQFRARFEQEGRADLLITDLSGAMDEVIATIYRLLMPNALGVAVIATGGYGRAELFPHSDIDLLFLYRPAARRPAERVARTMLYLLWDLGLKVGHALRTLEDTLALSREDLTIRTNLLDARLVIGDLELFTQFSQQFEEAVAAEDASRFVEEKLAERDERHRRFGDSRYLLEPNLKEGKGGLRDLHTLYWIARYVYGIHDIGELVELGHLTPDECQLFERARAYLWELRAHLHYVAGKAEERLTFDKQQELAPRMGYRDHAGSRAVERLMKRYFLTASSVGNITRIVCALLEEQHKRKPRLPLAMRLHNLWRLDGFTLDGERLQVKTDYEFTDPLRILRLFAVAQKYGYDIHPRALQLIARNLNKIDRAFQHDARANQLFMDMLTTPAGLEQTLRRMNEAGVLGRFIPAFGRIVGQMQFNMYHIYTVDEHIIVALGILSAIERGALRDEVPLATDIIARVQSKRGLYVSLLCHDIAKGRGGDHSEAGAAIAEKLALRLALSAQEAETVGWLVKNHLIFTATAFKRDISDPQTIRDFVDVVQSLERLRLLLLLTVADIRAVGPGIWNAWKATLLRNLYLRAEEYIRTGKSTSLERERTDLRSQLMQRLSGWMPEETDAYLVLGTSEYTQSLDADTHERVAQLLRKIAAEHLPMTLDVSHDTKRSISELIVVTPDQHTLFSKLAGAISLSGANIVSAKIFTLKNGMAVDIFQVQDQEGKCFDKPDKLSRMAVRMRQVIEGEIDLVRELGKQKSTYSQRRDSIQIPGQVFIENEASSTHTVIEVVGRDRVGFLHAVTRALSEAGLTIGSAHISTYGPQAVDVFYVKDVFGMKVTHDKKVQQLREQLLAAVLPPEADENEKGGKFRRRKVL